MCYISTPRSSCKQGQLLQELKMKAIKRRALQRQRASEQNEQNKGQDQSEAVKMNNQPLGRLPPLQAIGRLQGVDLEEPPDFDEDEVDNFLNTYEMGGERPQIYYFELEHAGSTAEALDRTFRILNPGHHVSKKSPENSTGFTHCKHGVVLGKKYAQLCELLETRARLQLIRDYASRINAASMFVKDLENVTKEECEMWYGISHNSLTFAPATKLECLSSICEDLRIHMNHWNSIKQLIHTDKWLRPLLSNLCTEMDLVRQKLVHLRNAALWWIDRLIHVGFRVLAHCDPERLGHDALWGITRGLEDFNNIVMEIKAENSHDLSVLPKPHVLSQCAGSQIVFSSTISLSYLNPAQSNSVKNLGESIKPIPFSRVLNLLACERAKYAAASTQEFFTASGEYLEILEKDRQSTFSWVDTSQKSHLKSGTETSDYHSASGSLISLSSTMLRVGNRIAPDLSKLQSPLGEFARREHNFALKFLQIVCHSTNLLKKPNTSGFKQKRHSFKQVKSNNSDTPIYLRSGKIADNANGLGGKDDEPILHKSDPKRKSVSWGDAAESSIITQLTQRYMDLLWQYFGSHLFEFLQNPVWGGIENTSSHLGKVVLCPDMGIMLLVRMIQQTCLKDIFPAGAVLCLTSIAKRLHVHAAWSAWDGAFCEAIASQVTDKCQPTPLADGDYATKTAKLLRDAFQPLQSVLTSLDLQEMENCKASLSSNKNGSLGLLVPTMERLSMTCDCATKWCHLKSNQFISGWALGSFFLITLSDMKILGDEAKQALSTSQGVSNTDTSGVFGAETQTQQRLSHLWHHLNNLNAHAQTLSGAVIKQFSQQCYTQAKDYFEDEMPVGKIWRKKTGSDLPSEHNPYVTHAMESLIEPIVSGVDKLKSTSHISAISIGVNAMCDAWTDHILRQHIRFSLYGAYQLELDFLYVRTWLETYIRNEEVKQSILCLDAFKNLLCIICLLKRQPRGRTPSRPPRDRATKEDRSCDVSVSNTSSDNWSNVGGSGRGRQRGTQGERRVSGELTNKQANRPDSVLANGFSDEELANHQVPKMEQWLALRVHGGARSWPKLPSCFTNANS